jgi:hypothetical protein
MILAAGCTPQASQADIEKMVRQEMSIRLEEDVKELKLAPQPDGGYAGAAKLANGDEYDVVMDRPRGGRVKWRLAPSQAMAERIIRTGLEFDNQSAVQELNLTKQSSGEYSGSAVLANGKRFNITAKMEGKRFNWQANPEL